MKNSLVFRFVVLSIAGCAGAAEPPASYTVISVNVDLAITQPLKKVDTVIQVGTNPNNRFTIHHLYHRDGSVKGSIILVPSLVNNFAEYLIDEKQGPMESLAASFARAHYDVYGYSPRTANLPPHACTTGAVDCSIMKNWDLGAYVQDVEYIRAQIATNQNKPVIGGLSLGGMVGVAAVNANPSGYSGLLLWESMLYSANPTIIDLDTQNCSNLRAATAGGTYYEENLPLLLKQLAQSGEAATIGFFGVPQPSLGAPNWIQLVADPTGTRYEFASFPRVFDFIMAFNNVESLPLIGDLMCSMAGDRTYTSNLRNFSAPILAIEGGQGFGNYMQDTINLTSSTKVRIEGNQAFGHLDAYLTSYYARDTVRPILEWLQTDVFPH